MAKKTFDYDMLEAATNGFFQGTAYYITKIGNVCYCIEAQWHSSKKNTFQCAAITENQQAQIEGAWNPGDSRDVRRIIGLMGLEFEPCKVK